METCATYGPSKSIVIDKYDWQWRLHTQEYFFWILLVEILIQALFEHKVLYYEHHQPM